MLPQHRGLWWIWDASFRVRGTLGQVSGVQVGTASTDTALSARRMLVIAVRSTLNNGNNKNKAAWRKGENKLNPNEVARTHQHGHFMEIILKRKKKASSLDQRIWDTAARAQSHKDTLGEDIPAEIPHP